MSNTALNRTTQALLTNKSGGSVNYGDVVILDNTNSNGFTTTTTAGLSTNGLGVVLEPNGIANNASGMVAIGGWVPKVNLNTASTVGQFIKSFTVAGQGTPHSSPQVEGDFAVALTASATPPALMFGSPNAPGGGSGTVTTTGSPASGNLTKFSGATSITNTDLTGDVTTSGGVATTLKTAAKTRAITLAIDGGGSAITTGIKADLYVPYACTITSNTMLSDQSGSIVVDIWKVAFASYPATIANTITASALPTISSATNSQDTTLTGWTTSVSAGDTLRFNVNSCTSITRLNLTLKVTV